MIFPSEEVWVLEEEEPYTLRLRTDGFTIAEICLDDAPLHDFNAEQRQRARLMQKAPQLAEVLRHIVDSPTSRLLSIGPADRAWAEQVLREAGVMK